ncbi:hypothetical protein OG21DRAFT_1491192 [Imleria badia]|nr:hypothetical protein OG21DRAFT_1491192 [Imleria badia]
MSSPLPLLILTHLARCDHSPLLLLPLLVLVLTHSPALTLVLAHLARCNDSACNLDNNTRSPLSLSLIITHFMRRNDVHSPLPLLHLHRHDLDLDAHSPLFPSPFPRPHPPRDIDLVRRNINAMAHCWHIASNLNDDVLSPLSLSYSHVLIRLTRHDKDNDTCSLTSSPLSSPTLRDVTMTACTLSLPSLSSSPPFLPALQDAMMTHALPGPLSSPASRDATTMTTHALPPSHSHSLVLTCLTRRNDDMLTCTKQV